MPFAKSSRQLGVLPLTLWFAACAQHATAAKQGTTPAAKSVVSSGATAKAPPKTELPERHELPLVLRETLSASMGRHGEELTFLLANVILLQYDDAAELAQLLADEPKLGRAAAGDLESLNALLPESFFVFQNQLSERAKALAAAARAKDDSAFVKAFGAVAETCVGCHASYLHDPLHTRVDHDERYEDD
jgi:hypothetical protein